MIMEKSERIVGMRKFEGLKILSSRTMELFAQSNEMKLGADFRVFNGEFLLWCQLELTASTRRARRSFDNFESHGVATLGPKNSPSATHLLLLIPNIDPSWQQHHPPPSFQ